MSKISDPVNHKNIVCPFCSLHCDDISIDVNDNKLSVKSDILPSCKAKFEKYNHKNFNNKSCKIKGKDNDSKKTSDYCKKLINRSKETLILNASSDVNICREILSSASKINGIVDHINSNIFLKNIGIYQRRGYMTTTLTEIKNKSDTIILFSNNMLRLYPRLMEIVIATKNSFSINPKNKKIFVIGNKENNMKDCNVKDSRITFIDYNLKNIPLLLESFANKDNKTKISNHVFNKLLKNVSEAKYLSVLWSTSELINFKECDQIIYKISEYIISVNETSRAACLSMSGNDGDASSIQTTAWISGYPTRIKFTGNYFEYDKDAHNSEVLIESNSIDLVIYINTISNKKLLLNKKHKNIVIGQPSTKCNIEPDAFIPCGVPGIDYKGHIFRTDNVVSLPLSAVKVSKFRSAQEILREIIQ
tara:strand:- start:3569 stop:4825 length:1257 start_codon:yes stop_codon:yes gene_type:complete